MDIAKIVKKSLIIPILLFSVATSANSPQQVSIDLVNEQNAFALKLYQGLKDRYIKNTNPLLIVWHNKLTLYHNNKSTEYYFIPKSYTLLKGLSHQTLAIFALFNPLNEFPNNIFDAINYRKILQKTASQANNLPLSKNEIKQQKQTIIKTIALLDKAIQTKKITKQAVDDYFESIKPIIMQNIDIATSDIISNVNSLMLKIQNQLTPEEQKNLFIVITVPKLVRNEYILAQYFTKILGKSLDSSRLIIAEGLNETNEVMELVSLWQVDQQLSIQFFNNKDRMKMDLLGKSAKKYLQNCKNSPTNKLALICNQAK